MTFIQYDGWQLSHDVHAYAGIEASPVYTDEELVYVNTFGARTQAMAKTLPSQLSTSASIYSPACYNHHISEQPNFWLTATRCGLMMGSCGPGMRERALAVRAGYYTAGWRKGWWQRCDCIAISHLTPFVPSTTLSENVTQYDALKTFLKAGGEGVNVWIDECEGYECGSGC